MKVKQWTLYLKFGRMIVAPIFASAFMGICTFFINQLLNNIAGNKLSTVISIIIGALIYVTAILVLRILKKEEILMIPFGTKIYNLLVKLRIYKEE